jgi:tetratricopeptide (TPR) repeat protein
MDAALSAEAALAERHVRRGDLLAALEIYDRLLDQAPDNPQLRSRKEAIGALLQPSELLRARVAPSGEDPVKAEEEPALTLEMEGERLANAGRFGDAAEQYERALEVNPKNDLLRERLAELRALAPPKTTARAAAPRPPPSSPAGVPQDGALPADPTERLQALLARITQNRRA